MKKLRKLLVYLMVLTMLFSFVGLSNSANAYATDPEIVSFYADNYGFEVGKNEEVTFTAKSNKSGLTSLSVYDDNGNFVTKLHETEIGVYEGKVTLSANSKKITSYCVRSQGNDYGEFEIRSYEPLTNKDLTRNDNTWTKIKQIRTSLEQKNVEKQYILGAVYSYLQNDSDVAKVWYEEDEIINFETVSGIGNIFSMTEQTSGTYESYKNTMDMVAEYADILEETKDESTEAVTKSDDDYIGSKTIGVFAPYFGVEDEFTMSYYTTATSVNMVLDGTITGYYGDGTHGYPACKVATFKNFDNFGIVMVDSHGDLYSGSSVICVNFAGSYDNADISQGHLVRGYDYIGVKGSYMAKYCDEMPKSIVYLGNCYGMKTSTLYQPLLNIGAEFIVGYDDPVSFQFDTRIGTEFMRKLKAISDETGEYNTCEEAYDAAVARYGMTDPYSSYKADFVCRGNENMRILKLSTVAVESIELSHTSLTMQVGDKESIILTVNPSDAETYTVTWESFSEDIATINSSGRVTAKALGRTTILCTVVDEVSETRFTKTCDIIVTEEAPDAHSVTFLDWNGNVLDSQTVSHGEDATPPASPTRSGYVFSGWDGNYTSVTEDRTITATYLQIGDATGDGSVNTGDAVAVLRHAVGVNVITGTELKCADITGDGNVNTGDAVAILRTTIS